MLRRKMGYFLPGMFFMGVGIAMITQTDLGTTPISTLPYVLSHILPGSFGVWTFILGIVFILLQMILLKTVKDRSLYLQIVVTQLFGFFIDLGMFLTSFVNALNIFMKIPVLLIGCFVLATGIYLQIEAKFVMNAGEAIVHVISTKLKKAFGTMKIVVDWTLVLTSAIIGLIFLSAPVGIGMGTLISAFLVGYIVKLLYNVQAIERFAMFKHKEERLKHATK